MGRSCLVQVLGRGLLALAVGCGGSAASGGTTTPANAAKDSAGNVIKSSSGAAVSKEAEANWREAVAAFDAADKSGWNESTCSSVGDEFSRANREQGGKFAEAVYMSGLVLDRCGKRDEALSELRAVQNVEDPTLLAALGVRFGRLKAFPDCIAALDKAIKLKAAPDLHVRRGVCRHDFGDDAGAQADYDAALKLDANFAPAHYYLGRHVEKKDKKKATESLEKALKLDPNGPIGKQAKEALEDLKKKK